jgi:hypothetical protein
MKNENCHKTRHSDGDLEARKLFPAAITSLPQQKFNFFRVKITDVSRL